MYQQKAFCQDRLPFVESTTPINTTAGLAATKHEASDKLQFVFFVILVVRDPSHTRKLHIPLVSTVPQRSMCENTRFQRVKF